jgi:uncharacterized Rmd1/YagE family protein
MIILQQQDMLKIDAYQIAEQIQIKRFRNEFTVRPVFSASTELFYAYEDGKYLYVFNYGVVALAGYNELEKSDILKFIKSYAEKPVNGEFVEDYLLEVDPEARMVINYNSMTVPELNNNVLRIAMLNTCQSAALDYYEDIGYRILEDTRKFTNELESFGKIKISKTDLLKFVGKTLNIKNSIVDNLYIFDAPDIVWENEYLEKIDNGLKDIFDIRMRFRDLDYKLKIVEDNLKLFTELSQNRESTRLEWIIILLILFEVLNVIFSKINEVLIIDLF